MGIHLADQTLSFLYACLLGVALGVIYDVFRICRVAFMTPPGVVFAQDVIYWIICAITSFLFLLTSIDGIPRMFLLTGELIGGVLYHFTLGQMVMRVAQIIIDAIKATLRFIYNFLLWPIWRFFYGIITLLLRPIRFLGQIMKKSLRKIKFRLKIGRIVLYNHYKGCLGKIIPVNKPEGNENAVYDAEEEERKTP